MPLTHRRPSLAGLAAVLPLLAAPPAAPAPEIESGGLRLSEMTLVASRGGERELLLRSESATLDPETRRAVLWDVRAEVVDLESGRRFHIECDRAEVEIESQDFVAEGHVRGDTGEGQRFATESVRYDRAADLLSADTPVELIDATGSLRGDGFRYHVAEKRFEILGNVRVEQNPSGAGAAALPGLEPAP